MMTFLALILVVALAAYYIWRGFPKSPSNIKAFVHRVVTYVFIGLAIFAFIRGFYLIALFVGAVAYFFARNVPGERIGSASTREEVKGDTSRVTTKWLDLSLNRVTGEISGRVLRGRFAGKSIAELAFEDLLSLREEVDGRDQQSVSILSAYIDRVHGGEQTGQASNDDARQQAQRPTVNMTHDEALDVLGLASGASETDVTEAHRRLMMLVHPDRGGSDYLAAKINAAKSVLLKKSA
jgi:hypothetical protein